MSEFHAEATISVVADVTLFRKQLSDAVAAAKKQTVAVKVTVDKKGFLAELRTEVTNAANKVKAHIAMEPDPTGFKAKLQAAADAAARGVKVRVGMTAGGPITAARGAVTGAATRTKAPVSATGKPLFGAAAATKVEADARRAEEAKLQEVVRKAEIKAHAENLKRDTARAEADAAARIKAIEEAQRAGLVSRTGQPLAGAAKAAKEEALAREKAELEALEKVQAAEAKAHVENMRRDLVRAKADEKARLKVLADLEAQGLLSKTGKPLTGAAREARLEAQAREKARADAFTQFQKKAARGATAVTEDPERIAARAQASKVLTKAQTAQITIDNAAIGAMTKLEAARAREAAAQKLATEATVARQTAERLGLKTTTAALVVEEELALQRLSTAQDTLKAASSEATLSKRRAFGLRGFGAQIATFAGLRGAVLSANAAFIAGTVGAIALGKAVQSATKFQTELNTFAAISGATAQQMAEVSRVAKQLGADLTLPGVTAIDAAQGMAELSKAGLDVTDSIGGIRGVLQLATAAQIDNAKATELTASALNAFGLQGSDAVKVADALANASVAAQGSIEDMGIALQQSATVARQVGLSIDQTVGVLTIFARAGLRGSDAGTSFRTMMLRLVNPTAKAQRIINNLGLTIRDRFGRLNLKFFDEFLQKTQNLTKREREQKLAIITGQDAIRGATILMREGADAIDDYTANSAKQGTAADLAAARTKGFAGSVENLKNQLTTVGAELGTTLLPSLSAIADITSGSIKAVEGLIGKINDLREEAKKPIDLVFKVSFGDAGDKGTLGRIKDSLGTFFAGSLPEQANSAIENVRHLSDVINEFKSDTAAEETQKGLPKIIADLNKVRNSSTAFNDVVKRLKEMQREMKNGSEETAGFRQLFDKFLSDLQQLSAQPGEIQFPITIPPELLHGFPEAKTGGKLTAKEFLLGFIPDLLNPMESVGEEALSRLAKGMKSGKGDFPTLFELLITTPSKGDLDPGVKDFVANVQESTKRAIGRQAGLEEEADILKIQGADPKKLRANLVKQAAQQRKIIADANKVSPFDQAAGDALKRRRAARGKLAGITADIQQIDEQAANDAKKKRDDADQKLLDSLFQPARGLETRALIAEGTETLKDDIAASKATIANNKKRIAAINAGFKDRKKAAELIADIADENIKLAQGIAEDELGMIDAESEAFGKRITIAESTGDIEEAIRLTRQRIAAIEKLIAAGKLEGKALKKYQDELRDRNAGLKELIDQAAQIRQAFAQSIFDTTGDPGPLRAFYDSEIAKAKASQKGFKKADLEWQKAQTAINGFKQSKEELQNSAIDIAMAFAQSVFDLTGNKNPLLAVIDAAIKEAKDDRRQAKKGTLEWFKAQTDINNLLDQRKQVLEDATEKSLTVFDLITQAREVFQANAGNVINADQTIAGATGFTADIGRFFRSVKPTGVGSAGRFPFGGGPTGGTGGGVVRPSEDLIFRGGGFADKQDKNNSLTEQILAVLKSIDAKTGGNTTTAGKRGGTNVAGKPIAQRRFFVEAGSSRGYQDS